MMKYRNDPYSIVLSFTFIKFTQELKMKNLEVLNFFNGQLFSLEKGKQRHTNITKFIMCSFY